MRLVYLDIGNKTDLPDRFRYIDQPWLYMFRTEIYSEEEYIEYLERNPQHNLLMSNTGVDKVAVHEGQMLLRRSSCRNVQKRRMKPKERLSRLQLTARVLQRNALLTQLPEHHPK
jgi:hypothetical protein